MAVGVEVVGHIRSDFPTKFGIPRQSGLVGGLRAQVVMEPAYRAAEAFRGLEGFSHIWLLWEFSASRREGWSPTVRPPRLGGNQRVGVFASRSPFRPSPIGLSCVELLGVDLHTAEGPVLTVGGADLLDGTPILDIKPYVPLADCRPQAVGGFSDAHREDRLAVEFPAGLLEKVPEGLRAALVGVLEGDPRPAYHQDPSRVYGLPFGGLEVKFTVAGGVLLVREVGAAREEGHKA